MKICCRCKEEKSIADFNKDKNKKDGVQSYCRLCSKVYYKKWQDKTPLSRSRHADWKKQRKQELRAKYKQYMQTQSCVDCGNTDWRVLEFDHLGDIEKVAGVAALVSRAATWETIEKEIKKCEPRCLNCHRLKSAERGNWWILQ